MSHFVDSYASKRRVGTLRTEVYRDKLINEWEEQLALSASAKLEHVDMELAVSAFMAED
jgi:hypothetical protein